MAFDPYKVTKEHVLQAIAHIKADGKELVPSNRWEVIVDNERYPPLEVLRYAHQEMNGEFIWEHSGGNNTNNYLRKLGFDVVEKNNLADPIKGLIQKYKEDIRLNKLANEVYKWKLLKQFQGRPNLEASDFLEELKSINYSNLIYPVGIGVIHHLAKDRTEPYRACFKTLFNEELPLAERLKQFSSETLKLFREVQPNTKHSHHHDERTMATLLTYHNPNKYALYKDSFYQKYCQLLGIKAKKVGEKYLHYLDLLNNFISDYLQSDDELLGMVRDLLPDDAFEDSNHNLLAQDILYRMLEGANTDDSSIQKDEKTFRSILKKSSPENLNAYFHTLDRLIEELGIPDEPILSFSTSNQLSFQIGMRYCFNLKANGFGFIAPESYSIEGTKREEFEGVTQPTLFKDAPAGVVLQHYPAIKQAIQAELENNKYPNKKRYDNLAFRKAAFDKEYRTTLFDFQETEAMTKSDTLPKDGRSPIPVNQILFGPPGTGKTYNTINKALEIIGEKTEGIDRESMRRTFERKVAEGQIVFTTFHQSMSYEDFIEGIKPLEPEKEGDPVIYRVEEGIFRRVCTEALFSLAKENESAETENVLDFSLAYNNLIQELEESLASEGITQLETKKGGQIIVDSITPQGNIVVKHPGGSRTYTVSKSRISTLQQSITNLDEVSNIDGQFRAVIGGHNSSAFWAVLNAIRTSKTKVTAPAKTEKERVYTWEEKKEVIRNLKKEDFSNSKGKPYVLIIDEINRGNVSQIFGELITLIEDDKRLGENEQLEITLPYSKERFGVPANLYIIGTMNTADRSVEALDTALRRRFSFVEMPPSYNLDDLQTEIGGYKLADILKKINRRIERLLSKDSLIGHSYFLHVKDIEGLRAAFQNKIIPLLQEYFYGDYGKIGLVLGEGFFEGIGNEEEDDLFASFGNYDAAGLAEKEVYQLAELVGPNRLTDVAFKEALDKLMS